MKKLKRTHIILFVLLFCGAQLFASEVNLLTNGSFENYSCGMLGCSFEEWSMPLGSGQANSEDKIDGDVSLMMGPVAINSVLDNSVGLSDDYYAPGTEFTITIQYKAMILPEYTSLSLDCYWEPEAGGDADAMKRHDAEQLQQVLEDTVLTGWKAVEVTTTKPEASARLRVRVVIPKGAKVLFDAFSVVGTTEKPGEPYISIAPIRVPAVSTFLGESVNFATIHVEQGNVKGTTTFELSGYDKEMFRLSATTMPADQSAMDIVVTYSPTASGTHTALLNIDNINHTSLFKSVQLNGSCIDTTQQPSITVIPTTFPRFEAVVGQDVRDTFTVISENCIDFVHLRVNHIKGAAFTIDGSLVGKNANTKIQTRFAPLEPGEYESTITIYSEGVDSIVMTLKGTGLKRDSGNIDWQTHFIWDESMPLTLMNETFDNVNHNKTLLVKGWQNVAAVDQRPWWGFDEAKTTPTRGTERYAKATAYQYGKGTTGDWQMFLVTPALDYKNAEGKIFAFSVMGEYMPDEDNPAILEIYYVDATSDTVFFQNLTEFFSFPTTSDENDEWITYFLNLGPYAETMADVFHMAFRYISPNGSEGAVTYYLDNISWGRTDLPEIIVNPTYIIDSTAVVGERKVLSQIEVTGKNLTNAITLGVGGDNYKNFHLSHTSLPAQGGTFTVSFTGQEAGVYEAYVALGSKGAVQAFIPLTVLCHEAQGIEDVQSDKKHIKKILRDEQIVVIRDNKKYNILGTEIQ